MSNSYNQNPILLDTTMASTAKNTAGTPWYQSSRTFRVKAIMWDVQAGGASKSVVLKDGLGNTIYSGSTTSPALPQPLSFSPPLQLTDFQLTTIGGGTLYLYLA